LTTATISQTSGGSYQLTGSIAGRCGGLSKNVGYSLGTAPTTTTVTYTANGQSHTAVRNSDGSIVDTNNDDPRCSARLILSDTSSTDSNMKLGLIVGVAVGGAVLFAIAAGIIYYYCCREQASNLYGQAGKKVMPYPAEAIAVNGNGGGVEQAHTIAVRPN